MLRSRISPCLLIHKKGLVKTVGFKDAKYVGDPINAVKIFNEKEVDELIVLDIDATVENKEPDFDLIEKLAFECRMPLCYGGGVSSVEHAKKLIKIGVEKIAISFAALQDPELLKSIGNAVGFQSVVVVLDVKKKGLLGGYEIYTHNGKKSANIKIKDYIQLLNQIGVGEIVVNSIDNDGTMLGYDFKLTDLIREHSDMPMTLLGGAGSMQDLQKAINRYGTIGVSAGSIFVFKGKYRAVLINYPTMAERNKIYFKE